MAEKRPAVLIVDDKPSWRELFSDLLEDEYEVASVGSYKEALRALDREPPFQVAVVDIRLDDKDQSNEDGLRLVERINQRKAGTKTVMVTGYPSIRTTKKAFRDLKVFDYIEKYPEDGRGFDVKTFRQIVSDAAKPSGDSPQDRPTQEATAIVADKPHQRGTLSGAIKAVKSIVRPISTRQWKESLVQAEGCDRGLRRCAFAQHCALVMEVDR